MGYPSYDWHRSPGRWKPPGELAIGYKDVFHQSSNAEASVAVVMRAMDKEGVSRDRGEGVLPIKDSEDFGRRGRVAPAGCSSSGPARTMRVGTIPTTIFRVL